jgi:hypothetical protein
MKRRVLKSLHDEFYRDKSQTMLWKELVNRYAYDAPRELLDIYYHLTGDHIPLDQVKWTHNTLFKGDDIFIYTPLAH